MKIFAETPFQLDPKLTLLQDVLPFLSYLTAEDSNHIASSTLTIKRLQDLPFLQQVVVSGLDYYE